MVWSKNRRKVGIFVLVIALLITAKVSAQNVTENVETVAIQSIKVDPENLFVGDIAKVTITLYNPNDESIRVSSVIIEGSGISTDYILDAGYIAPKSSHELNFILKAEEPGTHKVDIRLYSGGHLTIGSFTVFVEKRLPELFLDEDVRLGEVNTVNLKLYSPIRIQNVVIKPLFDSEPDVIHINEVEGFVDVPLKFFAKSESDYRFRISFYNGDNYHSYVVTAKPEFKASKGVFVNVSVPCTNIYLYDAVPITLTLTNLRNDAIYSVVIGASSAKGSFSEKPEISMLKAGESRTIRLLYSPHKSGDDVIKLKIRYEDELGNKYEIWKNLTVKVLESPAVMITNVNIEVKSSTSTQFKGPFMRPISPAQPPEVKISVSGDVSNNGIGKVRNTYVYVDFGNAKKDYFVGAIAPSDVESFSIPANGNEKIVKVTVEWTNELGETFSITKEYQVSAPQIQANPSVNFPLIIGIVTVVAIAAYFWRRRRRAK